MNVYFREKLDSRQIYSSQAGQCGKWSWEMESSESRWTLETLRRLRIASTACLKLRLVTSDADGFNDYHFVIPHPPLSYNVGLIRVSGPSMLPSILCHKSSFEFQVQIIPSPTYLMLRDTLGTTPLFATRTFYDHRQ